MRPQSHDTCSFEMTHAIHEHYLEVTFRGEADPQSIVSAYQQLVGLSEQSGQKKILLNASALEINLDADNLFDTVKRVIPMLLGLRVARILDPASYGFYLIDAQFANHDLPVRNFADEQEALSWLLRLTT